MAKYPNDDLFEGSKMTFGEHLEELRGALWRAVVGVAIGVLIGFLVGDRVVIFIQTPLKRALERYLEDRAITDLGKRYSELDAGQSPLEQAAEAEARKLPEEIEKFVRSHHVQPNPVYVHSGDLERLVAWMQQRGTRDEQRERERARSAAPGETPPANGVGETDGAAARPASLETLTAAAAAPVAATAAVADPAPPPILVVNPSQPYAPNDPDFIQIYTWAPIRVKVSAMNASESFMIFVQAAIVTGLVLSSWWVFIQIWNFVAEGLYPHEKQYVYFFLPISVSLFLLGAAMAFFFVFDPVLDFLLSFNRSMEIDPDPRISEWISFVLMLPLGFGVAFQLPLVMLFVERIGIVSVELYLTHWRIAILVIFVLSAILTPADPISMLLMAVPLTFLFFLGIGLCLWLPIGRKPFEEAYEP